MYASLCRRFAGDPVAAEIGGTPLQLLAGLHYLVLGGEASWDDVDLEANAEFLRSFVRAHAVQTNEVQRSWVLLPLFLHAVGSADVHIVELGASAGLNLAWDRWRYRYAAGDWGPPDGALALAGEERRAIPAALLARRAGAAARAGAVRRAIPAALLAERPRILSRLGIDLDPIDVCTEEGARLLRSFVWAGQDERLARLDRAIEAVRADPPTIVGGDVADVLPGVLEGLDGLVLVFQTAVFHTLSEESRAAVRDALDARETVFVSAGKPRRDPRTWGMRIYRPGGLREFVGHADYHGAWVDYDL